METFMFNLNTNQKYEKLKNGSKSIYCDKDYGPSTYKFGFHKNEENKMSKIKHEGLSVNLYYRNGAEILPNNSYDEKDFEIKEIEVYKIII